PRPSTSPASPPWRGRWRKPADGASARAERHRGGADDGRGLQRAARGRQDGGMVGVPQWLYLAAALAMLIILAPAMGRLFRDKRWPSYLAIWLAVAVALALAYRLFGWRLG